MFDFYKYKKLIWINHYVFKKRLKKFINNELLITRFGWYYFYSYICIVDVRAKRAGYPGE